MIPIQQQPLQLPTLLSVWDIVYLLFWVVSALDRLSCFPKLLIVWREQYAVKFRREIQILIMRDLPHHLQAIIIHRLKSQDTMFPIIPSTFIHLHLPTFNISKDQVFRSIIIIPSASDHHQLTTFKLIHPYCILLIVHSQWILITILTYPIVSLKYHNHLLLDHSLTDLNHRAKVILFHRIKYCPLIWLPVMQMQLCHHLMIMYSLVEFQFVQEHV